MNQIVVQYATANYVAKKYYKEGFRKGLFFGFCSSCIFVTFILAVIGFFTS